MLAMKKPFEPLLSPFLSFLKRVVPSVSIILPRWSVRDVQGTVVLAEQPPKIMDIRIDFGA